MNIPLAYNAHMCIWIVSTYTMHIYTRMNTTQYDHHLPHPNVVHEHNGEAHRHTSSTIEAQLEFFGRRADTHRLTQTQTTHRHTQTHTDKRRRRGSVEEEQTDQK